MPHLITSGGVKRCSVCGRSFDLEREPSVDDAFLAHLHKAHQLGPMGGDVNQTAGRIVRETSQD